MSTVSSWCRAGALAGICLLLAACAGQRARPAGDDELQAQAAREQLMGQWREWSFSGRISVSSGADSGSGRIEWQRRGGQLEVSLQAPVSRQSWRLLAGPEGATLEGLEGGIRHAADAETLLRDELGWQLPIEAVESWVRGARSGARARLEFDRVGLPQRLSEAGWDIEFRGWNSGAVALPQRVFAQSGSDRFRLVVDRWQVPGS